MPSRSSPVLLAELVSLCSLAGSRILAHYGRCQARAKQDGSPVTEADLAADAVIAEGLAKIHPGIPVLSEEAADTFESRLAMGKFILVDPLDGTREFLSGNGEFTVNVAVIENGAPVAGVVYAPVTGRAWAGIVGTGAETFIVEAGRPAATATGRRAAHVRAASGPLRAAVSRSHFDPQTEAWLAGRAVGRRIEAGSSQKFCLVAEGEADVYPRFSRTMEWDTAAGHAVLAAAGGIVATPEGEPLLYGKAEAGFANGPFIAASSPALVQDQRP